MTATASSSMTRRQSLGAFGAGKVVLLTEAPRRDPERAVPAQPTTPPRPPGPVGALFDSTVVHDLAFTLDPDVYDQVISTFSSSGEMSRALLKFGDGPGEVARSMR